MLEPELEGFLQVVDAAVEIAMTQEVAPYAIKILQEKIRSEVYAVDWPTRTYKRKYFYHGLLDPREIDWDWESQTMTLTVKSVRDDWEPTMEIHEGRRVADVVESGNGYDWRRVKPRPFHKPAEDLLIASGTVDAFLNKAMREYTGGWKW